MVENTAVDLLNQCIQINTERGSTYNGGKAPERSFARIAEIVNTKANLDLKPSDIALILAELKYVRFESALATGKIHQDSLVDYVNYGALWAELVTQEQSSATHNGANTSEEDKYLLLAADAMEYLAENSAHINEAIPKGSTIALTVYSNAVKHLNELNKSKQEVLFGSTITDLMEEELDD